MKDLRYFSQNDDYVMLYDYTGDKEHPFLIEVKIAGHRHENLFSSICSACAAFNEVVKTIQTTEPESEERRSQ
jgi:hypothetical protein